MAAQSVGSSTHTSLIETEWRELIQMTCKSRATQRRPLFQRWVSLVAALIATAMVPMILLAIHGREGWSVSMASVATFVTAGMTLCVAEFIRGRFRLSLVGFLVAFTVVTIALGYFGRCTYRASVQRLAAERITQAGGYVEYAPISKLGDKWFRTQRGTMLPHWVLELTGRDFFTSVETVGVHCGTVSTDVVDGIEMGEFPRIVFAKCHISSDVMSRIGGLGHLRGLQVMDSAIIDEDLFHLRGLKNLDFILIRGGEITDAGVEYLPANLKCLSLNKTNVSGRGLQRFQAARLLELESTQVSDAELKYIATLTNLEWLSLAKTRVTDEGLSHLKKLSRLRNLNVFETAVTRDGISRLQSSLPNVRVRPLANK